MSLIAVVAGFVVGLFPRWAATQLAEAFPALLDGGTLEIISRNLTEGPPYGVALLVFAVVVGAPIFEEICFRGLLWNAAECAAPMGSARRARLHLAAVRARARRPHPVPVAVPHLALPETPEAAWANAH